MDDSETFVLIAENDCDDWSHATFQERSFVVHVNMTTLRVVYTVENKTFLLPQIYLREELGRKYTPLSFAKIVHKNSPYDGIMQIEWICFYFISI